MPLIRTAGVAPYSSLRLSVADVHLHDITAVFLLSLLPLFYAKNKLGSIATAGGQNKFLLHKRKKEKRKVSAESHSGHIYSATIAATAFRALLKRR